MVQGYLVAVRGFCSRLSGARLQQLIAGQVQRLPEFLAFQETKHEESAAQLGKFGQDITEQVLAACRAALEQLERQLAEACSLHHSNCQALQPSICTVTLQNQIVRRFGLYCLCCQA